MSKSVLRRINRGAYEYPFSGVGIEYYPVGTEFDHTGLLLHEIGYLPRGKNWNFPNVFSPFWRLYYNSDSGHSVKFGDMLCELGPEHLMLIPSHFLFHCIGRKSVRQFWIQFSINKNIDPQQRVPILLKPSALEQLLIKTIKNRILKDEEPAPTDTIYRHGLALLNIVTSRPEINWQPPYPPRLSKIVTYIDQHLPEPLSNSKLADIACLSIEGLSKMFRKHLDISPAEYVTRTRIRQACHLLLTDDSSIDKIAGITGFSNRNHFSRVFKKITNESPARFRRVHRTDPPAEGDDKAGSHPGNSGIYGFQSTVMT